MERDGLLLERLRVPDVAAHDRAAHGLELDRFGDSEERLTGI